ncbi:uncharacterized protein LOC116207857 [Punica granatum]|uniref:Uncharacterized protein LOC116207857 n=1 Tax=Punica granatum TaxID=22663 RepID=A0A6P8DUC6_PUNGR|nr:uncharacterized protein LOC116207857 [Punica granatum]
MTPENSEDEGKKTKRTNKGKPYTGKGDDEFCLKMRFESSQQFRQAVQDYAVKNGKSIRWVRSGVKKAEARCAKNCPWKIYGRQTQRKDAFVVTIYDPEHRCYRSARNRQASLEWLANHYLERFRQNPDWSITEMMNDLDVKFALKVTKIVCYRARAKALTIIRWSLGEHYNLLPSYIAELKRVNRDSLFDMMVERNVPESAAIFKRFYVGFEGLKQGFLNGCRPVISLDGCFLKTHLGGQLLSAIGRDGNNQMFPIAWAVVEGENEDSWRWFLHRLTYDLGISDGFGWTMLSDQQKGLQNAVRAYMPNVEHRFCARHLYANWKKNNKITYALTNLFWKAVKCPTAAEFNEVMNQMKVHSQKAHDNFKAVGLEKFCMHKISIWPKCEVVDNNMSECFNAYILNARTKPIIDMLEDIRRVVMKRLADKRKMILKCNDTICPRVRKKLEENKLISALCTPTHAGREVFEVVYRDDTYGVELKNRTCGCRMWDLTGIPCPHAIAGIHWLGKDAEDFVDDCYTKNTYLKAYDQLLQPLNGKKMWEKVESEPILPPIVRRQIGRPKKARKKDKSEKDNGKDQEEGKATQEFFKLDGFRSGAIKSGGSRTDGPRTIKATC